MIPFTSGTYHGLFVDTEPPSILPKDISYFDFRTQRGRAVPSGDSPNLVVRFNSGGGQGLSPMMMFAFTYRAIEGNREGFIAFGSLVFEPFSSKNIENGIRAAISIARNSSSIFNGKVIMQRPTPGDGRPLDLTGLPLFGGEYFFGELSADINDRAAINQISELIYKLVDSGLDDFEVVINPLRGMTPDGLTDHFAYLSSKQKQDIEELRERKRRLKDRSRQDAYFEEKKAHDRSKRTVFLLQVFALGLVGVAVLGLIALLASKFFFTEDEDKNELSLPESSVTKSAAPLKNSVSDPEVSDTFAEKLQSTDCAFYEEASAKIITNLLTSGRCIKISNSVLAPANITHVAPSDDRHFPPSDWMAEPKQAWLTTFGRIVDANTSSLGDAKNNKFDENDLAKVLENEDLGLAISMETPKPRLFCNAAAFDFENGSSYNNELKFTFFTTTQYQYRSVIQFYSLGVLKQLHAIVDETRKNNPLKEELGVILQSVLSDLFDSGSQQNDGPLFDDNWDSERMCVVVVTQEDQHSFRNDPAMSDTVVDELSIIQFMHRLLEKAGPEYLKEKEELLGKEFRIDCNAIPSLLMVWPSKKNDRSIIVESAGFDPYTEDTGDEFDYSLKSPEYINREYRLAEHPAFDALESYFKSDSKFLLFAERRYSPKEFCSASKDDGLASD